MTQLLTILIIVAGGASAPTEPVDPEATVVFRCIFDEASDVNYDGWPDGWTRRRGLGYPHYLKMAVDTPSPSPGGRSLRFNMDGGAAVALTPPIPVRPEYDWVLECYIQTQNLVYDRAFVSMTFLDERRQTLPTTLSDAVHGSEWQKIRLGPLSVPSDEARFVVIGLHVEPQATGRLEDLHGSAWFGDIWLARVPRMILSTGRRLNLFDGREKDKVEITCRVQGLNAKDPQVKFELHDVFGQRVDEGRQRLSPEPDRTARWQPTIPSPGFYRITAQIQSSGQNQLYQRTLKLAVTEPLPGDTAGDFGWCLPRGLGSMSTSAFSDLLAYAGVSWVKYPVWSCPPNGNSSAESDQPEAKSLAQLTEWNNQLGARGAEMIGMLGASATDGPNRAGFAQMPLAADLFSGDPAKWSPTLQPVLRRLGSQIRSWQLGSDRDVSFVGFPNLAEKTLEIKTAMASLGPPDMELGFAWNWLNQLPVASGTRPPWHFLILSADPPLTPRELDDYLEASASCGARRWVMLQPLSPKSYSLEDRANDLVQQILTARVHKAERLFLADPFDPEHGVVEPGGAPDDLFLVWRTACTLLGGSTYLGKVEMPNRSHNQVFARPSDAVMVVWNEHPAEEVVFLGENVRVFDIWGRSSTPEKRPQGHVLRTGPLPVFVTGVSAAVVRWCAEFQLTKTSLPSILGQPQPNFATWKNTFPQRVTGRVDLSSPDQWTIAPRQILFQLEGGEEFRFPFQISLPNDATAGRHLIRADFAVQADRPYNFSAYGHVQVGLDDVRLEISTRLNPDGEMEVEQRFLNDSGHAVSYRCQLFAPGRQRQKVDLAGLAPGVDVKIFRLPDGRALVGKNLWVRAEEINGPRILNYRVTADP